MLLRAKAYSLFVLFLFLLPLRGTGQSDTALVRTFGGKGIEKGADLATTSDGGLLLLGNSGDYGSGSSNILLIRTDSNGIFKWSRSIGGPYLEVGTSIQAVSDSTYIIAGYTTRATGAGYNGLLIKVNEKGDTLWTRDRGGPTWDFFNDITLTPDSGVVAVGRSYRKGSSDIWVQKNDSNGTLEWDRLLAVDSGYQEAHSVIKSSDTSFTLAGVTSSQGPGNKAFFQFEILKNGDSLWLNTYGGAAEEIAYGIAQASNGDRLLTGSSTSFSDGDRDVWTIRTDDMGNLIWDAVDGGSQYYGNPTSKDDVGKAIMEGPSSNILINGMTLSFGLGMKGMYMIERTSGGGFEVAPSFGDSEDDEGEELVRMSSQRSAFLGTTKSYGNGRSEIYLVIVDTMVSNFILDTATYTAMPTHTVSRINKRKQGPDIKIYPNPSSKMTRVDLSHFRNAKGEPVLIQIYDQQGQKLFEARSHQNIFRLKTSTFSNGIYRVRVIRKDGKSVVKPLFCR